MLCKGDKVRFLDRNNLRVAINKAGLGEVTNGYVPDVLELANKEFIVNDINWNGDDVRLDGLHSIEGNHTKFSWRILESYLELVSDNCDNDIQPIFGCMNY